MAAAFPVDPHPKFKNKSALEVILTTLHSGGKFNSKVYATSGGLHGVGVSVVNALSDELVVEVARDRQAWTQSFSRGKPTSKLKSAGPAPNRRGTTVTFHPDPEIFGKQAFVPERLYRMARSKAYLFRGVEIRWRCDKALLPKGGAIPEEESFHFPGGLKDYLTSEIGERPTVVPQPFAGEARSETNGTTGGKVEWAVWWPDDEEGFVRSYCNTVPTPDGGTHESGFRSALVRGLKRYAELTGNRKGSIITADDVIEGAAGLVSVFIEQPQFQGQTKERLVSVEATKLVETIVGDNFEHWLTGDKEAGNVLLEHVVAKAEERLRRKQDREQQRKTATRKLRLPGKLADCSNTASAGTEIFLVEGDSAGGSAKAARNRETQAILPLRGKILNVASASRRQAAREPGDPGPHPGAGLRHRRALQRRAAALRAGHHHDRRRRRRRAHRLAADDVLLSRDAEADRERPSLPRPAAALPPEQGRHASSMRATSSTRTSCCATSSAAARSTSRASRAWARCSPPICAKPRWTRPSASCSRSTCRPRPTPTTRREAMRTRDAGRGPDGPQAGEALRLHPGERPFRPRSRRLNGLQTADKVRALM